MIKITVLSQEVTRKDGSFEDESGKERKYTTYTQRGKWEDDDGFVMPYSIRIEEGQPGYNIGQYRLDTDAMMGCKNERHNVGKFTKLVPLTAAAAKG
jgi:hypothetical protein